MPSRDCSRDPGRSARLTFSWAMLACVLNFGLIAQAQQADRRDRQDPELMIESGGRMGTCDSMAFTPDGRYLLAAGDDKVVRVWSFEDGALKPAKVPVLRWPVW